jgi:hypothetical protein
MLTLPWTGTDNAEETSRTVIAGRLPLRSYRDLLAVLVWVRRLRRHMNIAGGLTVHAAAFDKSPAIWIVSVWTNRDDLLRFERSVEHQAAKLRLSPRLRPATFVVWTCPAAHLPITWSEVRQRIAVADQAT